MFLLDSNRHGFNKSLMCNRATKFRYFRCPFIIPCSPEARRLVQANKAGLYTAPGDLLVIQTVAVYNSSIEIAWHGGKKCGLLRF